MKEQAESTGTTPRSARTAIIIAIIAGLLSVVLLKAYVARHQPKTAVVMVAKESIEKGKPFAEGLLVARSVPEAGLNMQEVVTEAEFLAHGSAFQTHQAQVAIPKDAPILRAYFAIEERTFAKTIPTGMRAVAVRVDESSSVAYALEPGDHVDVLAAYLDTGKGPLGKARVRTEVLLEDVSVLRTGHEWGSAYEKEGTKTQRRYTSVTLALTIPDATQLLEAQQLGGRVTLVLRNPSEVGDTRRTSSTVPLAEKRRALGSN